jgi:hypothetical protein
MYCSGSLPPKRYARCTAQFVRSRALHNQFVQRAVEAYPDPQSDPPMSGPTGDLMRAKWSQKIPPGQGSILDGRCGAILGLVFA